MNLGKAQAELEIKGLRETLSNLKSAITGLENLDSKIVKSAKKTAVYTEELKKTNSAFAALANAGGSNFSKQKSALAALRREHQSVGDQLKNQIRFYAKIKSEIIDIESKLKGTLSLNQNTMGFGALDTSKYKASWFDQAKFSAGAIGGIIGSDISASVNHYKQSLQNLGNTVKSFGPRFVEFTQSYKGSLNRLSTAFGSNKSALESWWQRFGLIAVGFGVAYRAINLVENAMSSMIDVFKSGLVVLDDMVQGSSIVSGMLSMMSGGMEHFNRVNKATMGTMLSMQRFLPKYGLSMEEATAGLRELAQFNVGVGTGNIEKTMNVLAVIKEIAANAPQGGDTIKQIRQEIQALFDMRQRTSDQFNRFVNRLLNVKTLGADFHKKLLEINSASTDTATKWRHLEELIWSFNAAIVASKNTIPEQLKILKSNLGVISGIALSNSGIWDKWVTKIREFNDSLFDSKGKLTEVGAKFYRIFSRGWHILDSIGNWFLTIPKKIRNIITYWNEMNPMIKKTIEVFSTLVVGLTTFKVLFSGIKVAITAVLWPLQQMAALFAFMKVGIGAVFEGINLLLTARVGLQGTFLGTIGLISAKVLALTAAIAAAVKILDMMEEKYNKDNNINTAGDKVRDKIAEINYDMQQLKAEIQDNWFDILENREEKLLAKIKSTQNKLDVTKAYLTRIKSTDDRGLASIENTITQYKDQLAAVREKLQQVKLQQYDKFASSSELEALERIKSQLNDAKAELATIDPTKPVETIGDKVVGAIKSSAKAVTDAVMDSDFGKTMTGLYNKFNPFNKKLPGGEIEGPPEPDTSLDLAKVLEDLNIGAGSTLDKVQQKFKSLEDYLAGPFSSVFTDVVSGDIKSFGDYFERTMERVANAFASALDEMLNDWVKVGLNNIFKGQSLSGLFGGSNTTSKLEYQQPQEFASGGMLTEPIFGIGASGRAYSFVEDGRPEAVVGNKDLSKLASGGSAPMINIINKTSTPVKQDQTNPYFDGRELIVDIILEDIAQGGRLRGALGS